MILTRFRAEGYRNIVSSGCEFREGVNLLYGENAQGKTNAMEAIYSFARGKSFRGASDGELISFGGDFFQAEIGFRDKEREQTLSYRFAGRERKRMRNGVPITRLSEMIGQFRAVLFCPGHLQLVKGGPAERRAFLNIAISQCYPVYLRLYADYQKILDNRNCLLKFAQKGISPDREELLGWSASLASCAAKIHLYRRSYTEGLSGKANEILHDLSGGRETLSLTYESDAKGEGEEEIREEYLRFLTENHARECAAGTTLYGVQRDDLCIRINGLDARSFASQGQQRSAVLAMKLAEGEVSRSLTGEYPVFLFDDVLSELDESRRSYVLGDPRGRQFIITACETGELGNCPVYRIRVENGSFHAET